MREISHPDYNSKKIDGGYIFGIVRYYSTDDSCPYKELLNANWSDVEEFHTLIKSGNKNILHMHPMNKKEVIIPAVLKENILILAKCNNPHLEGINRFLKVELLN